MEDSRECYGFNKKGLLFSLGSLGGIYEFMGRFLENIFMS